MDNNKIGNHKMKNKKIKNNATKKSRKIVIDTSTFFCKRRNISVQYLRHAHC